MTIVNPPVNEPISRNFGEDIGLLFTNTDGQGTQEDINSFALEFKLFNQTTGLLVLTKTTPTISFPQPYQALVPILSADTLSLQNTQTTYTFTYFLARTNAGAKTVMAKGILSLTTPDV